MSAYTPMEIKAARALNKQMAYDYQVNEQDQWNLHSEEMKDIARIALEACGANAVLKALDEIAADYADRFDLNDPSTNPGIKYTIEQARAAITKATK